MPMPPLVIYNPPLDLATNHLPHALPRLSLEHEMQDSELVDDEQCVTEDHALGETSLLSAEKTLTATRKSFKKASAVTCPREHYDQISSSAISQYLSKQRPIHDTAVLAVVDAAIRSAICVRPMRIPPSIACYSTIDNPHSLCDLAPALFEPGFARAVDERAYLVPTMARCLSSFLLQAKHGQRPSTANATRSLNTERETVREQIRKDLWITMTTGLHDGPKARKLKPLRPSKQRISRAASIEEPKLFESRSLLEDYATGGLDEDLEELIRSDVHDDELEDSFLLDAYSSDLEADTCMLTQADMLSVSSQHAGLHDCSGAGIEAKIDDYMLKTLDSLLVDGVPDFFVDCTKDANSAHGQVEAFDEELMSNSSVLTFTGKPNFAVERANHVLCEHDVVSLIGPSPGLIQKDIRCLRSPIIAKRSSIHDNEPDRIKGFGPENPTYSLLYRAESSTEKTTVLSSTSDALSPLSSTRFSDKEPLIVPASNNTSSLSVDTAGRSRSAGMMVANSSTQATSELSGTDQLPWHIWKRQSVCPSSEEQMLDMRTIYKSYPDMRLLGRSKLSPIQTAFEGDMLEDFRFARACDNLQISPRTGKPKTPGDVGVRAKKPFSFKRRSTSSSLSSLSRSPEKHPLGQALLKRLSSGKTSDDRDMLEFDTADHGSRTMEVKRRKTLQDYEMTDRMSEETECDDMLF